MSKRPGKDLAASVRQRLYNKAKADDRPFQEMLQRYAMERFLYRLSQSPHADKFVLKGALMFAAWRTPFSRPTKDIDLLGRMGNDVDTVLAVVRDICLWQVQPDGLAFDVASLQGMTIKEDADYEGVRVTFSARLANANVRMQLDVGFGDVLTPAATLAEYPPILDLAPPRLWGYSRETSVAEKFEAMLKLGVLNSRMKDFFDIWFLAGQCHFDGDVLADAIARTCAHRGTPVTLPPVALTREFALDRAKREQWRGFLRKSRITSAPQELGQVVEALAAFLLPVAHAVHSGQQWPARWEPPGPWTLPGD